MKNPPNTHPIARSGGPKSLTSWLEDPCLDMIIHQHTTEMKIIGTIIFLLKLFIYLCTDFIWGGSVNSNESALLW